MNITEGLSHILNLPDPWFIESVAIDKDRKQVRVTVNHPRASQFACPESGAMCAIHDHGSAREWRHLDLWDYRTYLIASLPRVRSPDGRVRTIACPWSLPHSRLSIQMEHYVIDQLQACQSVQSASRLLGMGWDQVRGVMERAVERGESRRSHTAAAHIGVDEKAIKKGHQYATLVYDLDRSCVLHVSEDRTIKSLASYYDGLQSEDKSRIESVCMDMWTAYATATRTALPDADDRIVHDRFHVMQDVNNAVNAVRKAEAKALSVAGDNPLKGTRQLWLFAEENLPEQKRDEFESLRTMDLDVATAWAQKENLRHLWECANEAEAHRYLNEWLAWVRDKALKPMLKVADQIERHRKGIINYCVHRITNGVAEGLNSKIMSIKRYARGFRKWETFRIAVLFFCGKLDMEPRSCEKPIH